MILDLAILNHRTEIMALDKETKNGSQWWSYQQNLVNPTTILYKKQGLLTLCYVSNSNFKTVIEILLPWLFLAKTLEHFSYYFDVFQFRNKLFIAM